MIVTSVSTDGERLYQELVHGDAELRSTAARATTARKWERDAVARLDELAPRGGHTREPRVIGDLLTQLKDLAQQGVNLPADLGARAGAASDAVEQQTQVVVLIERVVRELASEVIQATAQAERAVPALLRQRLHDLMQRARVDGTSGLGGEYRLLREVQLKCYRHSDSQVRLPNVPFSAQVKDPVSLFGNYVPWRRGAILRDASTGLTAPLLPPWPEDDDGYLAWLIEAGAEPHLPADPRTVLRIEAALAAPPADTFVTVEHHAPEAHWQLVEPNGETRDIEPPN